MKRLAAPLIATVLIFVIAAGPAVHAYVFDTTIPSAGGCPQPDRWSLSLANPLTRQWSTSLPLAPPTIITAASAQTGAQLAEIEQAIADSFAAWTGVSGTTFNATAYPGLVAPIARVSAQNACSSDGETNVDGLNTICFNQASAAFTTGVLAFTRVITANAPGVSAGSSVTSTFAGQILDADTLFRPDGQGVFATPAGLATTQGKGAYDLESILAHELGHWFGLDHSPVWRAMMFPYAPPPGNSSAIVPQRKLPTARFPTTIARPFAPSIPIQTTRSTPVPSAAAFCPRIPLRWPQFRPLPPAVSSLELSERVLWQSMRTRVRLLRERSAAGPAMPRTRRFNSTAHSTSSGFPSATITCSMPSHWTGW